MDGPILISPVRKAWNDEIPTPRDVMIMSLADACDLWPTLIHEPEVLARFQPRIKHFARMDLIGQAVTQAIQDL